MNGDDTGEGTFHRGFEGLGVDSVEALLRSISDEDRVRNSPPPDLWRSIAVEAGVEPAIALVGHDGNLVEHDGNLVEHDGNLVDNDRNLVENDRNRVVFDEDEGASAPPSNVRSLPRWVPVLTAAAAVALIAGVVGIWSTGDGGSKSDVLATAELDPLAAGFTGTAFFEDSEEGLDLRLDLGELPADDGFYELWIIKDLETGQMQSLGPISGSGTVPWPQGFDPADYSVVDISIEPSDGVPTHSGASVLRGELQV